MSYRQINSRSFSLYTAWVFWICFLKNYISNLIFQIAMQMNFLFHFICSDGSHVHNVRRLLGVCTTPILLKFN